MVVTRNADILSLVYGGNDWRCISAPGGREIEAPDEESCRAMVCNPVGWNDAIFRLATFMIVNEINGFRCISYGMAVNQMGGERILLSCDSIDLARRSSRCSCVRVACVGSAGIRDHKVNKGLSILRLCYFGAAALH